MRARITLGALAIVVFVLSPAGMFAATPVSSTSTSAHDLVQAALAAEAKGDGESRAQLLEQAIARYPNFTQARWHSGFVRAGDKWLTVKGATAQTRLDGVVSRYRQLRDQLSDTAAAHLDLADWCERIGLKDQQRVHLVLAAQANPTNKETQRIIKKLNLVRFQGRLITAAQLDLLKEQAKESKELMQKWKPLLATIQSDLGGRDPARRKAALAQLRAMDRPAAIPAFEMMIAKTRPPVSQTIIDSLGAIRGQAAADALVRCALYARNEDTREAAAEALKHRSVFSYVPTVMNALEPLVQVQFDAYWAGNFRHQVRLYQEGPTAAREFSASGGSTRHVEMITHIFSRVPAQVSVKDVPDQTFGFDLMLANRELMANETRTAMNNRVAMVLRTATGENLDSKPDRWWSWWFDYNEMYQPSEKPVMQVSIDRTPLPLTYTIINASCFPAGTPVQTSIGPVAIDQVRAGDSVLAQDTETGEVVYKPVLVTTIRPHSPLVNISTGRETIRATRGHPFWVCGVGWQMAKELKAGQSLHTLNGPVRIESCEERKERPPATTSSSRTSIPSSSAKPRHWSTTTTCDKSQAPPCRVCLRHDEWQRLGKL